MQNEIRYATIASVLILGACAHAPQQAEHSTYERITRVMREVQQQDSSAPGVRVLETKASESVTETPAPTGVDLSQFELPVQYNEQVQQYIDLYAQKRRAVFTTWLNRMGRYRSHIEAQLQESGLPRELVYLPLIESAYEPSAASHASAVGLWQFMAGTARSEGLEVSEYLDERRDPIRSTQAAIRHLRGLYNYFGSWYLTAAAYNVGSTRIAKMLKEGGHPKGSDDVFWQIQDALPKETQRYVPMLLAATIIGENTESFGITTSPRDAWEFETVTVGGATELRAVARAAGTTLDVIKSLNPQYIKSMTPPERESEVRVPVGGALGFDVAFGRIPKEERTRALTKTHVVKSGETLSGIAKRYGTSVAVLQKVNRIKRPDAVAAGRKIQVPIT